MAFVENNPTDFEFKEVGDYIVGKLLDIRKSVGPNKSTVYTIGNESIVHVWGSIVLDQRMKGIEIGDTVKIQYEGLGIPKPGRHAPKLFRVWVDKDAQSEKKEVEAVAQ